MMRMVWISMAAVLVIAGARESRAGYYTNVAIDGVFADWDAAPVAATDIAGDGDVGPDLAELRLANDETNLYVYISYHASINPNAGPSVFLALDNDVNTGTGFDIFGLGLVGSEAGWQNDFPFQQSAGNFSAGTISGGAAAISPYNTATTNQEYAIPLAAMFDAGGDVFPSNQFRLLVYTDPTATNETMGPVTYTLSPKIEAIAFEEVQLDGAVQVEVNDTLSAVRYSLEESATPGESWDASGGGARGNGGTVFLYDATDAGTTQVYRVKAEW